MSHHTLPPLQVQIQRLSSSYGLPAYALEGSAGLDLYAAIEASLTVAPRERILVPTGVRIAIPLTHEGQVRPRSGLALNHGITVLNSPGTIDAAYRGEIQVILINLGHESFTINRGMRIAQLVIAPVACISLVEVTALGDTMRGNEGFGSTGLY